jgi:hypothetical protein
MYRRLAVAAVVTLAALGLMRAAASRYQEKMNAIEAAFAAQLQKEGLTRAAVSHKYPTPYINSVTSGCLTPGGTGEVTVQGNFVPGTKFVFLSDDVEVLKESLMGQQYKATVKVAPGIGPRNVEVWAMLPSMRSARSGMGAKIGGRYEWTFDASNGWRIVARSRAGAACGTQGGGQQQYEVEFFRKGETTAFKKRLGSVTYDAYNSEYDFRLEEDVMGEIGGQDPTALMQKLMDPKLTNEQREQVMKQLQEMQKKAMANIQNAMANAKQIQEDEKQFGCRRMLVKVQGNTPGALEGEIQCAAAVGNRLRVTGAMKFLGM